MNIYLGDEKETKKFYCTFYLDFNVCSILSLTKPQNLILYIAVYNNNSNLHLVEGTKKTKN